MKIIYFLTWAIFTTQLFATSNEINITNTNIANPKKQDMKLKILKKTRNIVLKRAKKVLITKAKAVKASTMLIKTVNKLNNEMNAFNKNYKKNNISCKLEANLILKNITSNDITKIEKNSITKKKKLDTKYKSSTKKILLIKKIADAYMEVGSKKNTDLFKMIECDINKCEEENTALLNYINDDARLKVIKEHEKNERFLEKSKNLYKCALHIAKKSNSNIKSHLLKKIGDTYKKSITSFATEGMIIEKAKELYHRTAQVITDQKIKTYKLEKAGNKYLDAARANKKIELFKQSIEFYENAIDAAMEQKRKNLPNKCVYIEEETEIDLAKITNLLDEIWNVYNETIENEKNTEKKIDLYEKKWYTYIEKFKLTTNLNVENILLKKIELAYMEASEKILDPERKKLMYEEMYNLYNQVAEEETDLIRKKEFLEKKVKMCRKIEKITKNIDKKIILLNILKETYEKIIEITKE